MLSGAFYFCLFELDQRVFWKYLCFKAPLQHSSYACFSHSTPPHHCVFGCYQKKAPQKRGVLGVWCLSWGYQYREQLYNIIYHHRIIIEWFRLKHCLVPYSVPWARNILIDLVTQAWPCTLRAKKEFFFDTLLSGTRLIFQSEDSL